MAFNANDSNTAVVKEGKLYTGLKNMKVIAINPTQEEMVKIGYNPKNPPVYLTDGEAEEGKAPSKKLRLDFFLEGDIEGGATVRTKIAFFLENKHRVNQAGTKGEWINDAARSAWGGVDAAPDGFQWFDAATARKAYIGEVDVHLFLVNWLNIQPGDEAKLDNFAALFTGDYSELRQILAANSGNEVKVLLTVRDGRYQSAYTRYFDRATNKRTTYWENHLKKQAEDGYPLKEDFSHSLTFQEWTEPSVMIDAGDGNTEAGGGDNVGGDIGPDPF